MNTSAPMSKAEFELEIRDLRPQHVDAIERAGVDESAPRACARWDRVAIDRLGGHGGAWRSTSRVG